MINIYVDYGEKDIYYVVCLCCECYYICLVMFKILEDYFIFVVMEEVMYVICEILFVVCFFIKNWIRIDKFKYNDKVFVSCMDEFF